MLRSRVQFPVRACSVFSIAVDRVLLLAYVNEYSMPHSGQAALERVCCAMHWRHTNENRRVRRHPAPPAWRVVCQTVALALLTGFMGGNLFANCTSGSPIDRIHPHSWPPPPPPPRRSPVHRSSTSLTEWLRHNLTTTSPPSSSCLVRIPMWNVLRRCSVGQWLLFVVNLHALFSCSR